MNIKERTGHCKCFSFR